MLPYQPIENRSGQIYADLSMMGSRALAGGIQNAGQSIGQDLKDLNLWDRQVQQAQGMIQAAQPFEDQVDERGNVIRPGILPAGATAQLLALPPAAQVGAAQHLVPLASAAAMNNYRQQLDAIRQEREALMKRPLMTVPWPTPGE